MPITPHFSVFCDMSEEKIHLLQDIVVELASVVSIPDYNDDLNFVVTGRSQMPLAASEILEKDYLPGDHAPNGLALERELEGRLRCFIILSEESMDELTAQVPRPPELISTVLEELIHVSVYSKRWLQLGYLEPSDLGEKKFNAYKIARAALDEYVASRAKNHILLTIPLVSHPSGPEARSTCIVSYRESINAHLDSAEQQLYELLQHTPLAVLMSDYAGDEMTRILYREILEPLSREVGFYDGAVDANCFEITLTDIKDNEFHRDWIHPYWIPFLECLRESYKADLEDQGKTLENLVKIIEELRDHLDRDVAI